MSGQIALPPRPLDLHRFWRSPELPFLEARQIEDGRQVCYCPHSHSTFSVGSVRGGRSSFEIGGQKHEIEPGTVVLINPEEVHACNPLQDQPWSYRMLYVDPDWLTALQGGKTFRPYADCLSRDPSLFAELEDLFDHLFEPGNSDALREGIAASFFVGLEDRLCPATVRTPAHPMLDRAVRHIDTDCARPLFLADLCRITGLSPAYLVRSFKARFGLSPHAYQSNRRIRLGQELLRRGASIAEVALTCGFADQAHFQRVFKRHVAATPGQFTSAAE